MNAWPRYGRIALLAAAFVLFGASYGWLRSAYSGQESRAVQTTAFPRQVLVIRHAEKPDDDTNIHLTSRGAGRAAALPSLFLIPPTFPSKSAPFVTPDFIFATKESKRSNRPVETVTPLAKALGDMPIHHKQANEKYADVIDKIFREDKYAGKTVLICWHHGTIPELAHGIATRAKNAAKLKAQIPARWDGSVFDRVWAFTFDDKGSATFSDHPQKLLFGDSKK